ncbi:MAG: carboxynorspermidine decarboxylase [Saccharofermentanales bacterium]|jgi:carboxynorspermidine decarboxylase|nr:carboxynorspermidine decarboxylase [Clostridiaceae bacterium]
MSIDFGVLPTPCYVVDESLLIKNLEKLKSIQDKTGARILLALKGYSMYATFPLIGRYLAGVTASSLFEARLGREEMGKEVHIYSPAFIEAEFDRILTLCDHIVFNSFDQWRRFKPRVKAFTSHPVECGIRINPEYSEVETSLYDPSAPFSRLGVTLANFQADQLDGLDGLHFHTMCEQNSDTLERTVAVVDRKFGPWLGQMKWLNFGGGHHITRADYDRSTLIRAIKFIQEKYGIQVYLEPGEAIALNAGFLVSEVLDIVHNGMPIAILDTSAACHMPDVLEMPYRPAVIGAAMPGEKPYTIRLGGPTCLAGDIIGDYSFDRPLKIGDRLVFCDMAHYTMVKNNMFNGINLPAIALAKTDGRLEILRQFQYEDYKSRLS